ncbi:MAG: dihydroorotate dehydrogenase [Firmicutes bacterium]|jgi:dihydroorotate dehydrogenase (NAD+) catalytic subunit|nr:dihydroorotate dehydrogenase [Bacillota bacterium]
MSVAIGGLKLRNPVIAASGVVGYGVEYADLGVLDCFGAIVVKGTTLAPRAGNPPPRLAETPSGLLNSVGLENPGVDAVIREVIPRIPRTGARIIVNVAGATVDEYCRVAEKLDRVDDVDALEINISCPNVRTGGIQFGTVPETSAALVEAVRKCTGKVLIVKLTPNTGSICEVAKAVEQAGADAVSLINTILGMAIDVQSRRPVLSTVFGGLSGPAVKPIALRMVWQVSNEVTIPVVGMGGISEANDALEFLMAGASAVAVGTALLRNPRAGLEIVRGLEDWLVSEGMDDIRAVCGSAKAVRP